jgi:dipeptidyl aminopeptidase/acylaminoacyl peptidase
MTGDERLQRALPGILADLGAAPAPDYADLLLARTGRTRQRPAWVFPERWLPMDIAARQVRIITPSRRLVAATVLLLIAAVVALVVLSAGTQSRLPAPFGVAGNGGIVFVESDRLVIADPVAGSLRVLVPGGEAIHQPRVSPDGTKAAFFRGGVKHVDGWIRNGELTVIPTAGGAPRAVSQEPIARAFLFDWAPDSQHVVVATDADTRVLFDVTQAVPPTPLAEGVGTNDGLDYNPLVSRIYRPPAGQEWLFVDDGGIVIGGPTATRSLVGAADLTNYGIGTAQWSPDGSMVVFIAKTTPSDVSHRIYVVNADGTGLRTLTNETRPVDEGHPQWSPDGRSIAIQQWFLDAAAGNGNGQEFRPIVIVDVATGASRAVGDVHYNGYDSWAWSPDGRYILQVPGGEDQRIILIDVATGASNVLPWKAGSPLSWQRLAATPTPPG